MLKIQYIVPQEDFSVLALIEDRQCLKHRNQEVLKIRYRQRLKKISAVLKSYSLKEVHGYVRASVKNRE